VSADNETGPQVAGDRRRLDALLETSSALLAALDDQQAAETAQSAITSLLDGIEAAVTVHLRGDDGAFVHFPPSSGADEPRSGVKSAPPDEFVLKALDGQVPVQAAPSGKRPRLVVPLVVRRQSAGYIELKGDATREFGADELALVQLAAAQLAVVVDNVRLRDAAQRHGATDPVTGLYNRWYFFERLYSETLRAARYRQPLSLIVMEIDEFATFAAARGPQATEYLLRAVARVLNVSLRRKVDVTCHQEGGHFAVLLPNTTCFSPGAALAAERLRAAIEATEFRNEDNELLGRFRLSLGVAGYPTHAEEADELTEAADKALAAAQRAGGNKVVIYTSGM
jgi:diguanylate cyclase (GGDEF)-like protein